MAQVIQPASASQHLGLSASGARGPTPQVAVAYPSEWTSNSPGSNLEGGLGGGRSQLVVVWIRSRSVVLPDVPVRAVKQIDVLVELVFEECLA